MLKSQVWLKRAEAILAGERFDGAAALSLVQEIRNQAGAGTLGMAAGQALGALQAANQASRNKWQSAVARHRLEEVRHALARHCA